ncbi:kinesin-domain-containing protein [Polychaeton citri CBS 116435]|uniref:Kinesin-domain-containing protein n=1 Tax=Polychaeton citri CBS 116435 TaxID=1314669 RepID=A0A9P4USM4_9PEZI|nr:kinesin-domain-containing protein [Polychaeton citri CBS 116435]
MQGDPAAAMDTLNAVSPPTSPVKPFSSPAHQQRPSTSGNVRAKRSSSRLTDGGLGISRSGDEGNKTAVKVAVRVRPPLRPSDPGFDLIPQRFRESTCEVPAPANLSIQSPQGKKLFLFDRVFDETSTQQGVWEYLSDSVSSFVQGYNVSILAYGQSGAGKSFTMGTSGPTEQNDHDLMGVVPRAAQSLFEKLNGQSAQRQSGLQAPKRYSTQALPSYPNIVRAAEVNKNWSLKATYVEIYNEQLRDLLLDPSSPDAQQRSVVIREDTKGRILLTGLTQVEINSVEDLLNALNSGSAIRQTDATAINARSSRSHAVFSLNLVQKKSDGVQQTPRKEKRMSMPVEALPGSERVVTLDSKLHFVDLAGSERLKNTGATGERAKEGISINAGLASLGKVISQLSSRNGAGHISYRDSRLTRMLQDSLGGSAITFMIACVTPAVFHLSETLNTVHYAQRARAIQTKPEIQQSHEDTDKQAAIERLRAEVAFLRDQVRHSQGGDVKGSAFEATRPERNRGKEAELHTQLMDMQENYNALSQRHAKLISEISKARDTSEDTPMLNEAIGENAVDRLKRSNSFAEAVEHVVLEYEKTIQTLESSLSKTRATLSGAENTLLERETRISYMETIQQQLQTRIQKAMDREQNNEAYLRDLETRMEGTTSGEERNLALIEELRKELERVKESENSAEDYISTLEERLAEAEQDHEIMQRELDRLEHVVERQRSIGRLDNLLGDLDASSRRQDPSVPAHQAQDPADMSRGGVPTTNGHATADDPDEYDPFRPSSPSTRAAAPHATDQEALTALPTITPDAANESLPTRHLQEGPRSPAQNDFMADKVENLTQELFDLRSEHESSLNAYDTLQQKYETALRALAQMEFDKSNVTEESKGPTLSAVPSPHEQQSPSQSASEDHSFPEHATENEETKIGTGVKELAGQDEEGNIEVQSKDSETELLRRLHAENKLSVAELTDNYNDLAARHQETLQQVEELKLEVQRAQSIRPTSPSVPMQPWRRRSDDILGMSGGTDRTSRSFASLQNLANEHFEENPDARQNFELNLNSLMTELRTRSERVKVLEAELGTVRKEMENKQQLIAGLSRERSSMKATSSVDFSIIGQMREQLEESEKQIRGLHETHSSREKELHEQIESLKTILETHQNRAGGQLPTPHDDSFSEIPGQFPETPAVEVTSSKELGYDQALAGAEKRTSTGQDIAALQRELATWEMKHNDAMTSMKMSEAKLLDTIADLEDELQSATYRRSPSVSPLPSPCLPPDSAASASLEQERFKHQEIVSALQREANGYRELAHSHNHKLVQLEESYAAILRQVGDENQSRDLTVKELQTHKELVANLENQLQVHKSTINIHQESLESLQAAHSREMDDLKSAMDEAEKETRQHHAMLEERHAKTSAELESSRNDHAAVIRDASSALGYQTDAAQLKLHIQGLVDEGKELHSRHIKSTNNLKDVQEELRAARDKIAELEEKTGELRMINEEALLNLQKITEKERKSSRLVEELEDQLNNQFDSHQAVNNRFSALQTEKDKAHADLVRDLEEQRKLNVMLEQQLNKRASVASESNRGSVNYNRDSLSPEAAAIALARSSSQSSNVHRKSQGPTALPTPPPSIPLPPLPGTPDGRATSPVPQTGSPPGSRHTSRDVGGMSQLVEDQDARIRTIEKHLFAEKQLTATLEEALVDLETSTNRTKTEMETWRKKCASLEDELISLRKERTSSRASVQAVEEEREMRMRAEKARQALEERMRELNASKKKKKSGLNCF